MKSLIIALALLTTTQAFATKARVLSLGNSFHLVDEQFGFANPNLFRPLGNFVTLETGLTTPLPASTSRVLAEGIISYGLPDANRVIVALGKRDDMIQAGRNLINSRVGAGTYGMSENPIHVFYLTKSDTALWAGGLFYSNYNNKQAAGPAEQKEAATGMSLSYRSGDLILFGDYAFVNTAELANGQKFDGAGYMRLAGRYISGDNVYGADVFSWNGKSTTSGVENESYGVQQIALRYVRSSKNTEGSELFYGASVLNTQVDCRVTASASCSSSFKRTNVPVIIGAEFKAADWLTLRGSITQSALYDTTKDEIGLTAASGISGASGAVTEYSAAPNNTAVAAGAGLKFNNFTVDGSLAGVSTQVLNANTLLSQLSLSYKF